MKEFALLGDEIETAWRATDYDDDALPEIAARSLRKHELHKSIGYRDVLNWLNTASTLPAQKNIEATFGDPPITVYDAHRFFIDALFWVDAVPGVHEHGFVGAFQVLEGSSLHGTWNFERTHRISHRLEFGRLQSKCVEVLRKGDVREIQAGSALIHSTFHLDKPSMSVVVRCNSANVAHPQYAYMNPHLAWDPHDRDERRIRRLQALKSLHKVDAKEYEVQLVGLLERSDLHSCVDYIRLDLEIRNDKRSLLSLLQILRKNHGDVVDYFIPIGQAFARGQYLRTARAAVENAEHRFFFAIAINALAPKKCLEVVKAGYPDSNPIALVLKWVRELSKVAAPSGSPPGLPNVLGVDVDDAVLSALQELLSGSDSPELAETKRMLADSPVLHHFLVDDGEQPKHRS